MIFLSIAFVAEGAQSYLCTNCETANAFNNKYEKLWGINIAFRNDNIFDN